MEKQHIPNKKTTVYLPPELDQWIRGHARQNRRSYNSEIVWLLERQREELRQQEGRKSDDRA